MSRSRLRIPALLAVSASLLTLTVLAATPAADSPAPQPATGRNHFNVITPTEDAFGPFTDPAAKPLDPVLFREVWICQTNGPAEVQGFRVQCNGANFLDFVIADCCVPGDHWELKGKNWDANPNTGVTTSPGPAIGYGLWSRVYNYGGAPTNPGNIDTYVECTYLHGVDLFAAGSYITFASDGACTVTPDVVRSRINRTP